MQASIDIESEKHRRIQLWNTISISLFPLEANDDLHKKKKKRTKELQILTITTR